ncbi:hypothetical protein [Pedobacter jeongneungensis]|uniref:hypothetical protein n=1 Tax=Pedobacter jeongneungensis TaxID=947309 RepID=UPI000468EBAC|nr:hypothetical protein [Pedobacter jeongneungensis]
MKRLLFGAIAGFGVAAVFLPRMIRNILTENRLLSDNAHIERHKKTIATITKNKLTDEDYRNRYPHNT